MNPGKHQSSKQRGQDLDWKVHDRAHLLFFTHTLCMNYVIAMFLLVSCVNTSNLLLYFARFGAQSTPKIVNKNLQQRTSYPFTSIKYANTVYYTYSTRYKCLLLSVHVLWSSFLIFHFHILLSLTTCTCWFCFLSSNIWG